MGSTWLEEGGTWTFAGNSNVAAVLLLLCLGLVLASREEGDSEDVPAICSDILPRELFLTDPAIARQCHLTPHHKVDRQSRQVALVLEWDASQDDRDTIVDIELYSIQKQNGTYLVHSMVLMKDVDNTGHVDLPEWTSSALESLKGDDLLFRVVEASFLDRKQVTKRDLRSFVLVLDRCPTLVNVLRTTPKMVSRSDKEDQFSFKVNIKPPAHKQDETEPKKMTSSAEEDQSLELRVGGSKDSITLQVNSGGETVSVKVGAKEKTVSLKVDSSIKFKKDPQKPKYERGVSLSDGFEEIEEYLAREQGLFESDVPEENNSSMIYRAMIQLRSAYLIARTTVKYWRDRVKIRTNQYVEDSCYNWYVRELKDPPMYDGLPVPPCNLAEAISCPLFSPDTGCNNGRGYCHFFHRGAYHCVRSVNASVLGSGEQACYDQSGRLLEYEQGGGTFDKAHPEGYINIDFSTFLPKVRVFKIWRISHFIEDVWPFILCCKFTNHCDWYGQVRPTRLSCQHYDIDPDDTRLRHRNFRDMRHVGRR